MASSINTNISSLTAQRNLGMSQTSLATSMQRLSSGLRINSAKDDAAGLAISERFTTQVRGLNQASRNANDGISLAQTAEGSLGEITSNLQRIRELAVQSANSTNSASDRAALDLEVQQRLAEIDRVSSQSSFNGVKILDGSFGDANFQVGANVGETIAVSLSTSMRQSAIGALATVTSVDLDTLISPSATAGVTTTAAITPTNFSIVAGTAGVSTLVSNGPPVVGDTVTVNGVIFTYADAGVGGPDAYTVVDATHVTLATDLLNTTSSGDADSLKAAFDAYKAAGGPATAALDAINATVVGNTLTFTDTQTATAMSISHTRGPVLTLTDVTPAVADDTSPNSTITVAGTLIALNTNITSAADLVGVINAGLIADSNTTVTASVGATAGTVVFTTTATGAAATAPVQPSGAGATALGIAAGGTQVNGAASSSLAVAGDFSIAIGSGAAVQVAAGTYTTQQSLVDAVNTAMGGNGYASLDAAGVMTINSTQTVTVAGSVGNTTLGLAASTTASGSLLTAKVTTVDEANTAIQRVDSALTAVSTLRSTFGAIQNRFESVIANLSTTAENLSAARSRIQDADFATETANLSRAQILQQAGTAMVAQANQLPQGVLALLR